MKELIDFQGKPVSNFTFPPPILALSPTEPRTVASPLAPLSVQEEASCPRSRRSPWSRRAARPPDAALLCAQVDIGGYFRPDPAKVEPQQTPPLPFPSRMFQRQMSRSDQRGRQSLSLILSYSVSVIFALILSHSLSFCLCHILSHSLSFSLILILSHSHPLSFSLSPSRPPTRPPTAPTRALRAQVDKAMRASPPPVLIGHATSSTPY